jgi:hypothetical protein
MKQRETVAALDEFVPQLEIAPHPAEDLDMGQKGRDSHVLVNLARGRSRVNRRPI